MSTIDLFIRYAQEDVQVLQSDPVVVFDNDRQEWLYDPAIMRLPWFLDGEGLLYIAHTDGSYDTDAPFGPDVAQLPQDARRVPLSLKRFDPVDGYYTA